MDGRGIAASGRAFSGARSGRLNPIQWTKVVIVAGIGTVLEWFDFYVYAQLSPVLTKVFFPESDDTAAALAFWGIFAAAFVVRPLGGLIFGHIGDAMSRNMSLIVGILSMAVPTVLIGCLPGYSTPSNYSIGTAAPVLLVLLRVFQGLAMGGEYGTALTYISELAPVGHRGLLVATLQCMVQVGMILATGLVMILTATLSSDQMMVFGWRIPFLLGAFTAFIGFFVRQGLPEPHAKAVSMRREAKSFRAPPESDAEKGDKGAEAQSGSDSEKKGDEEKGDDKQAEGEGAEEDAVPDEDEEVDGDKEQGPLSKFHAFKPSNIPVLRLIMNDWMGVILHVFFMAWVSGAFYTATSWNVANLINLGTPTVIARSVILVSFVPCSLGQLALGYALDKGLKAMLANGILVTVAAGTGFGVFYGMANSYALSFILLSIFLFLVGIAVGLVALPCTRIYDPLQRTTGFSFAYNVGFGVIGGLSPLAVTAIQTSLKQTNPSIVKLAPAFWLLPLAFASVLGSIGLRLYMPRLNKPFIGKML